MNMRIRQRVADLPVLARLVIGNSAVIVAGAVGGTLLTSHVARLQLAADAWLILLFVTVGILVSLGVNFWIARMALRPLHQLVTDVDRVQVAEKEARVQAAAHADPGIRRLAGAINMMLERLDRRALELRALSERAITAQEEERKRIARGMHDDTGQSISILIINLDRMQSLVPRDQIELSRRLAETRQLAVRTLDDLRKVVYGLRPTMLDDLGLVPAIRWYAKSQLEEAGIRVEFDLLDQNARLPAQLETALFRIAQEAVNNVTRHADADSVMIVLRREGDRISLEIEDDGRGFDVAQVSGEALRTGHFGMLGMQERTELVGGEMTIESVAGRGTKLAVRVPVGGTGDD